MKLNFPYYPIPEQNGQVASSTNADVKTIRGDKITWVKGTESHCQSIGSLINQVSSTIHTQFKLSILRSCWRRDNGHVWDGVPASVIDTDMHRQQNSRFYWCALAQLNARHWIYAIHAQPRQTPCSLYTARRRMPTWLRTGSRLEIGCFFFHRLLVSHGDWVLSTVRCKNDFHVNLPDNEIMKILIFKFPMTFLMIPWFFYFFPSIYFPGIAVDRYRSEWVFTVLPIGWITFAWELICHFTDWLLSFWFLL